MLAVQACLGGNGPRRRDNDDEQVEAVIQIPGITRTA